MTRPSHTQPGAGSFGLLDHAEPRRACPTPAQLAMGDLAHRGGTVIDIGAGTAADSLYLADAVGPRGLVRAFEANPLLVPLAQLNLTGASNCRLTHVALAGPGEAALTLAVPARYRIALDARTGARARGKGALSLEVKATSLDSLCRREGLTPALVRLPAASAARILQGAARTLAELRPAVVVCGSAAGDTQVSNLLRKKGYRLYDGLTYTAVDAHDGQPTPPVEILVGIPSPKGRRVSGRWHRPPAPIERLRVTLTGQGPGHLGRRLASDYVFLTEGRWIFEARLEGTGAGSLKLDLLDHDGAVRASDRGIVSCSTEAAVRRVIVNVETPAALRLVVRAPHLGLTLHAGTVVAREVRF